MTSNFGEKLQKTRRSKKISLDKVEKATQVQKKYLQALEEGRLDKLPGEVYARNFVKKYTKFLNINTDDLLEDMANSYSLVSRELKTDSFGAQRRDEQVKRRIKKSSFLRISFLLTPKIFKNFAVILVFLFCFAYLGVEAKGVFDPPQLEILGPSNNLVLNEQMVNINGKTEPGSDLCINDEKVLIDGEGNFSENINLQPGVNVIEISANKKYSKNNVSYIRVLVVEE